MDRKYFSFVAGLFGDPVFQLIARSARWFEYPLGYTQTRFRQSICEQYMGATLGAVRKTESSHLSSMSGAYCRFSSKPPEAFDIMVTAALALNMRCIKNAPILLIGPGITRGPLPSPRRAASATTSGLPT